MLTLALWCMYDVTDMNFVWILMTYVAVLSLLTTQLLLLSNHQRPMEHADAHTPITNSHNVQEKLSVHSAKQTIRITLSGKMTWCTEMCKFDAVSLWGWHLWPSQFESISIGTSTWNANRIRSHVITIHLMLSNNTLLGFYKAFNTALWRMSRVPLHMQTCRCRFCVWYFERPTWSWRQSRVSWCYWTARFSEAFNIPPWQIAHTHEQSTNPSDSIVMSMMHVHWFFIAIW